MAKPYIEITKTEFNKNYNVVKVLTDKIEIMKQLETFNSNNQAVAFGIKKKPKVTLEDVILRLDKIENRLDTIEDKLDKHEQLFKNHGWIN